MRRKSIKCTGCCSNSNALRLSFFLTLRVLHLLAFELPIQNGGQQEKEVFYFFLRFELTHDEDVVVHWCERTRSIYQSVHLSISLLITVLLSSNTAPWCSWFRSFSYYQSTTNCFHRLWAAKIDRMSSRKRCLEGTEPARSKARHRFIASFVHSFATKNQIVLAGFPAAVPEVLQDLVFQIVSERCSGRNTCQVRFVCVQISNPSCRLRALTQKYYLSIYLLFRSSPMQLYSHLWELRCVTIHMIPFRPYWASS